MNRSELEQSETPLTTPLRRRPWVLASGFTIVVLFETFTLDSGKDTGLGPLAMVATSILGISMLRSVPSPSWRRSHTACWCCAHYLISERLHPVRN
ncbi:MAG: hypothetical protein WCF85_21625 [Rhodospirillaceae bacterium]